MARSGDWLFRHRSWVPFALLPLVFAEVYRKRLVLGDFPALDRWWGVGCMAFAFVGVLVRFHATGHAAPGTSGRNTRYQIADTLNTSGMYSITRNPLYLGNLVITLGLVAAARSWEIVVAGALLFLLYYERIVAAEEAYLEGKFGEAYRSWASRTPWLLPDVRLWRPAELPFSWARAVRSEYNSLFGITSGLFLIEHARLAFVKGRLELETFWSIVFVAGALVYVVCRTLKKRTRLLS